MTADRCSADAIGCVVSAWAAEEVLIRRIYLFGSRARGDHRPESDVDLAVLFDLDREVLHQCRGDLFSARVFTWSDHVERWRACLQARLPMPVDLQYWMRGDRIVRGAVKKDGIRLHRRLGSALIG